MTPALRVPARAAEQLVATRLAALLDSPLALIDKAGLDVPPEAYPAFALRAPGLAARVRATDRVLIRSLIAAVVVEPHCVRVTVDVATLAEQLGVGLANRAPARIELVADARLRRSGRAMRLVDASGTTASADPNTALIRLLGEAHRLWRILRTEPIDITRLAAREGMQPSYLTRVLRLAFLSPALTTAILEGRQSQRVSVRGLTLEMAIPAAWDAQTRALS